MDVRLGEPPKTDEVIPPAVQPGLRLLLAAQQYAEHLDRDIWDFALEASSLREAGLSNSDLRWLICVGFVQQACEVSLPGAPRREFRGQGGLSLFKRSCFVLTAAGREAAEQLPAPETAVSVNGLPPWATASSPSSSPFGTNGHGDGQSLSPCWDRDRHQFRVDGVLVKEFKVYSPNQETVLAAFQEEGWPPRIDDPLPQHAEIDPKRRLHDTIKSLNRNQRSPLVRFMGDGSGEAVRWELVSADSPVRRAK